MHLFLTPDVTATLKDFGEEDVEAFFDGQKDEAGHHGAQVVDDVIDSLVAKAENVEERHHVALSLCQDLLQKRLLEEAPGEAGQAPVD